MTISQFFIGVGLLTATHLFVYFLGLNRGESIALQTGICLIQELFAAMTGAKKSMEDTEIEN